jgi:hypothetical protein
VMRDQRVRDVYLGKHAGLGNHAGR